MDKSGQDQSGQDRQRSLHPTRVQATLDDRAPATVEATASYHWFVALVEPLVDEVVLANPNKLRVIAESTKKPDRLDAQTLAEFLARDMIPGRTCPPRGSVSTARRSATASTYGGR